jgi:hypothetical protein
MATSVQQFDFGATLSGWAESAALSCNRSPWLKPMADVEKERMIKNRIWLGLAAVGLMTVCSGCMSTWPHGAYVDNNVNPIKVGTASNYLILSMGYFIGDGGIDAAMKDGNITKVHHVDYESFYIPLFYWGITTKVYGE